MAPLLESATRTVRASARQVRRAMRRAGGGAGPSVASSTTDGGGPADASTSAAAAVWSCARRDGARSPSAYEQALRSAFAIDAARSELRRTRDHRARAAGVTRTAAASAPASTPASAEPEPEPEPDAAVLVIGPEPGLGAIDEPDVDAILQCYAGARASIRSLCLAAACAGVRRKPTVAPLLARVCIVSCMVDPAHNPLLGRLAATPARAARSLVEGEPLILDGRLAYGDAEVDLDDLDHLADLLQAATLATLAQAPTLFGRLRDTVARAR